MRIVGDTKMNRAMSETHKIEYANGHWEVKDEYGNFVLSGDTWDECYNDLVDMLIAEAKAENRMENIRKGMPARERGMYIIARLSEKAPWKKLSS